MDLLDLYKSTNNSSDKERTHTYISNFYNEKFKSFKNKEIKILEIGVLQGHSLKLWEQYFKKAEIYGVDIQNIIEHKYEQNVNFFLENAYNINFINKLKNQFGQFDIIIDDGPHTIETQLFFLTNYPTLLKEKESIIILEDVYPQAFEVLKNIHPTFDILDLREKVKNEYNSVIFYKEY